MGVYTTGLWKALMSNILTGRKCKLGIRLTRRPLKSVIETNTESS
jgi:hypothetical protein